MGILYSRGNRFHWVTEITVTPPQVNKYLNHNHTYKNNNTQYKEDFDYLLEGNGQISYEILANEFIKFIKQAMPCSIVVRCDFSLHI